MTNAAYRSHHGAKIENEVGTYGAKRIFSDLAEHKF